MDILMQLLLLVLIWAMVFFGSLPFSVTTQAEARDIVPGSVESAPIATDWKRKLAAVSAVTLVLWLVIRGIVAAEWVSIDDIPLPPGVAEE